MRRFILISTFIIILITSIWIGYLGWGYVNQKTENSEQTANTAQPTNKQQSAPAENQPTAISGPIAAYWITATTTQISLITFDGKIQKVATSGPSLIGTTGLKNTNRVQPSFDGVKAIINASLVFDTTANNWTSLPAGATAVAWHPSDNRKIVFLKNDGVYLFNLVTGKSNLLISLTNQDWRLDWPFADTVFLTSKPTSAATGAIWEAQLSTKKITRFISDAPAPQIIWSPAGWGVRLDTSAIITRDGKELVRVSALVPRAILATLPDKCIIAAARIICALPQTISPDADLPDDYLKRKLYTNDSLYAITVDMKNKTAQAELLFSATNESPIDAQQLSVNGDALYFINRYDQRLYRLVSK